MCAMLLLSGFLLQCACCWAWTIGTGAEGGSKGTGTNSPCRHLVATSFLSNANFLSLF